MLCHQAWLSKFNFWVTAWVQLTKCSPCKGDNLTLNPQYPCKNQVWQHVISKLGRQLQVEDHWNLQASKSSQISEIQIGWETVSGIITSREPFPLSGIFSYLFLINMFEERGREEESPKYNSKIRWSTTEEQIWCQPLASMYTCICIRTHVNTQIYHICTHIYTKDNKETV